MRGLWMLCVAGGAALAAVGWGGSAAESAASRGTSAESAASRGTSGSSGRIVYGLAEGGLFRIAAETGATPENLSNALDAVSPGSDDSWVNTSPDGESLIIHSGRFGCQDYPCMAYVNGGVTEGWAVEANGRTVHTDGISAVTNGGKVIIFPTQKGPNDIDLWIATGGPQSFSKPKLLTADSPGSVNLWPSIHPNGNKVVFSCGDFLDSYSGPVSVCRTGVDGKGLRRIIGPKDGPPAQGENKATTWQPHYAPDGSIVFESNWGIQDRIWRLKKGASKPILQSKLPNNVGPCVLPDGRVASLWLGRPGNLDGVHELTVTTATGRNPITLLPEQDVLDTGIGCGA